MFSIPLHGSSVGTLNHFLGQAISGGISVSLTVDSTLWDVNIPICGLPVNGSMDLLCVMCAYHYGMCNVCMCCVHVWMCACVCMCVH